jgi:hypothetical protein
VAGLVTVNPNVGRWSCFVTITKVICDKEGMRRVTEVTDGDRILAILKS